MAAEKLLHSLSEAAELLDCSQGKVYDLIRKGRLQPVKLGRYTKLPHAELVRFQQELIEERVRLRPVPALIKAGIGGR